jgi:hypothetical protein
MKLNVVSLDSMRDGWNHGASEKFLSTVLLSSQMHFGMKAMAIQIKNVSDHFRPVCANVALNLILFTNN